MQLLGPAEPSDTMDTTGQRAHTLSAKYNSDGSSRSFLRSLGGAYSVTEDLEFEEEENGARQVNDGDYLGNL